LVVEEAVAVTDQTHRLAKQEKLVVQVAEPQDEIPTPEQEHQDKDSLVVSQEQNGTQAVAVERALNQQT
jgi:RecA/RadA recombinase